MRFLPPNRDLKSVVPKPCYITDPKFTIISLWTPIWKRMSQTPIREDFTAIGVILNPFHFKDPTVWHALGYRPPLNVISLGCSIYIVNVTSFVLWQCTNGTKWTSWVPFVHYQSYSPFGYQTIIYLRTSQYSRQGPLGVPAGPDPTLGTTALSNVLLTFQLWVIVTVSSVKCSTAVSP